MTRSVALMAFCGIALLAAAVPAAAQKTGRCMVSDPTGTPLNIRTSPQGRIVGTISNGSMVRVASMSRDGKGQAWAYIVRWEDGSSIGWVFREFISCY